MTTQSKQTVKISKGTDTKWCTKRLAALSVNGIRNYIRNKRTTNSIQI